MPNTTTTSTTTTSTTTMPNTTTTTSTTTTSSTTSTPKSTTSTTTTTPAPTTTTLAPTLPPVAPVYTYKLKNALNHTIVMAKFGARFVFDDAKQFDLTNQSTIVQGTESEMDLVFGKYNLSFGFADPTLLSGSTPSKTWKLLSLALTINDSGSVKKAALSSENGVESIVARRGNSWACDNEIEFHLNGQFNVTIKTHDLRIEPYITTDEFGLMERCEADQITNNVVPIAVGAALAVLVVIVLVLYLFGRRKHQRGYQTV